MEGSMCPLCRHLREPKGGRPTCAAFLEGIPQAYVLGSQVHDRPVDGDNGLQLELVPEADLD